MATRVTRVTSAPPPNTMSPRRTGWRPSRRQKPDSRTNTQQVICCHKKPASPPYHGASSPNIYTRSHMAWYPIMLMRASPRSSSKSA